MFIFVFMLHTHTIYKDVIDGAISYFVAIPPLQADLCDLPKINC